MEVAKEKLRRLISDKLFWNFRNAASRRHIDYRLDLGLLDLVTDQDAEWFIRTYESGILTEVDGDFLAPRSSDEERIFWHGPKSNTPRRLRLAIEAIIGIGAVGRLYIQHGWPRELLALQPKDWKFDLATYGPFSDGPIIVGEVKTRTSEIYKMCEHFEKIFGQSRALSGGKENWNRKIEWLLKHEASVLWAIGPGGYQRIYRVQKEAVTGSRKLSSCTQEELDYERHFGGRPGNEVRVTLSA